MPKTLSSPKAQSILDYSLLFGIVTLTFFAIGPYIKRGVQAHIKTVADQIGTQKGAEQSVNRELGQGYLISAYTNSQARSGKGIVDDPAGPGVFVSGPAFRYTTTDFAGSQSNSLSNLGVTKTVGQR